jgi:hypothetical protein
MFPDWWYNVDCSQAANFFELNSQIGQAPEVSNVLNGQYAGQASNNINVNSYPSANGNGEIGIK